MNQPWKVVLVLVGIFVAGGITGAFVMVRIEHVRFMRRPPPEQWAPMQLQRLSERLDLTKEQQDQIQPIVKRSMDELRRMRNTSLAESRSVFERMQREIVEKLTPEQSIKFDQMNKEFRERARRFMQDRQNRPGGPGGPGGMRRDRDLELRPGEAPDGPKGEPPPGAKPPGENPPGV